MKSIYSKPSSNFTISPRTIGMLCKCIVSAADSCILIPFPRVVHPDDIPNHIPYIPCCAILQFKYFQSTKCCHKTLKLTANLKACKSYCDHRPIDFQYIFFRSLSFGFHLYTGCSVICRNRSGI